MKKYQKALIIIGVILDVAITGFLFVISLIMIVLIAKYTIRGAPNYAHGLILYLLNNTNVYFWLFVFPLFLFLAGNIIGLVYYVKKTSSKPEQTKLDDLSEEQREALKQELLKDLMKDNENNKDE